MPAAAIAVFLGAIFLLAYVLVGYPILLRLLAARRPNPVRKQHFQPAVSFVVPVHNGERYLAAKIDTILGLDYPRHLIEILIVADGCGDATESIAAARPEVRLLSIPRGGKCAGLNAGIAAAGNEILILTDIRQQLRPDSLQHLMNCLADPTVGVVSADLHLTDTADSAAAQMANYRRLETALRDSLSALDSMFGATGAYYAMRRSLALRALPLPHDLLLDDMYLPLTAFFSGYRLVIEPRAVALDIAVPLEVEVGRKSRTLAGNYQLLRYMPQLLSLRNRMLGHFLSYKVGRLLMPYLLILIAVSSFFLPYPLNLLAVGGQAAGYGLALADPWIPRRFPLKKLSAAARAFVAMMIATVRALAIFFVPAGELWKNPTGIDKRRPA